MSAKIPVSGNWMMRVTFSRIFIGGCLAALVLANAAPALADRIKNPTAVFAGLDKITGRIITFEVAIDETVQFGTLQVTPKICYTRPPTEAPQTDAFVEVVELTSTKEYNKLFSGWMFAASPGLHGVEHAVYDVWLTDCKGGTQVVATPPEQPALTADPVPPAPAPGTVPKKKKTDAAATAPLETAPAANSDSGQNNGPITVGPAVGARLPANGIVTLPANNVPVYKPPANVRAPAPQPAEDDGLLPPGDIPNVKPRPAKPRKIVPLDPIVDPNFNNLDPPPQ